MNSVHCIVEKTAIHKLNTTEISKEKYNTSVCFNNSLVFVFKFKLCLMEPILTYVSHFQWAGSSNLSSRPILGDGDEKKTNRFQKTYRLEYFGAFKPTTIH